MIKAVLCVFSLLCIRAMAEVAKPSVSVAVKESNILGGLDGLDLKWAGVCKLDDYVVGCKYALNAVKGIPESLFAKRTFNTGASGKLTVDTAFDVAKNQFSVCSSWASDQLGLAVSAVADTVDRLKEVHVMKSRDSLLGVDKVSVNAGYDVHDKILSVTAKGSRGDNSGTLKYDSKDRDPVLTVSREVNNDTFSPSMSLKTGAMSYGWKRKWAGGSVDSTLKVKDSLAVSWRDEANSGAWVVKAKIPLDDSASKAKIGIERDWTY